jgi:thioredoxin reductase
VTGVKRNGGNFLVSTPAREYQARHVVLAMGKRGTPRRLGVPGEDRSKVSYRLIEAETYEGKDVLVVGGGDSAVEAALALTRDGRNRVTVSYRGSTFQRARDRNQTRLQEAEQQRNVRVLRNSHVIEIGESTVRLNADGKEMEIPNDFVFVLIGGESPEEFLKKTGVEIVEKAIATWSFS